MSIIMSSIWHSVETECVLCWTQAKLSVFSMDACNKTGAQQPHNQPVIRMTSGTTTPDMMQYVPDCETIPQSVLEKYFKQSRCKINASNTIPRKEKCLNIRFHTCFHCRCLFKLDLFLNSMLQSLHFHDYPNINLFSFYILF